MAIGPKTIQHQLDYWLRHRFLELTVIAMGSAVGVVLALGYYFGSNAKTTLGDYALCGTTAMLVATMMQLVRNHRTQQVINAKDFLAEFRKDSLLNTAYFDLIYSYRNSDYDQVSKHVRKYLVSRGSSPTNEAGAIEPALVEEFARQNPLPDFGYLPSDLSRAPTGSRRYWPGLSSFSLEERRLDLVLDYFNAVGFYHREGLVALDDIVATLGDYLTTLERRRIVQEYFALLDFRWRNPPNGAQPGNLPETSRPHFYLRHLLNDVASAPKT